MATSMKTPVTLLIIGGVLLILTISISIPAFLGPEEVILTGDDFGLDQGGGGYKATVPSEDLRTTVVVRIWGRTDQAIGINLIVKDGGGSIIEEMSRTTPMDETIVINGQDIGTYSFIVKILDDGYTLNNIFIEITQDEITDMGLGLCCGAMLLGPISSILILVGFIMLLVRVAKGKKEKAAPAPVYRSTWDEVNRGYGPEGPAVHQDGIRIDPYYQKPQEAPTPQGSFSYPTGDGGPGYDTDLESSATRADDEFDRPRMAPPPPTS